VGARGILPTQELDRVPFWGRFPPVGKLGVGKGCGEIVVDLVLGPKGGELIVPQKGVARV